MPIMPMTSFLPGAASCAQERLGDEKRGDTGSGGILEEATAGRRNVGHGGLFFFDEVRLSDTQRAAASCSGVFS